MFQLKFHFYKTSYLIKQPNLNGASNSGFCFLFNKIADSVRRTSDYQVDGKTVAFSHVSASPSWVAAGAIGDTAATTQQQREGGGIGKRRRSCWVAPPDTRLGRHIAATPVPPGGCNLPRGGLPSSKSGKRWRMRSLPRCTANLPHLHGIDFTKREEGRVG